MCGSNFRFLCLVIILICLGAVTPGLAATGDVHHDLSIRLFPERNLLEGEDRIDLPAIGLKQLTLRLAGSVEVLSVTDGAQPITFTHRNGWLQLEFSQAPPDVIQVLYRGTFRDQAPAMPAHNEDPSYGVAATISPAGTFLSGASGWYPQPEGFQSTFSLRVSAPMGYEAITSGKRLERRAEGNQSVSRWTSDIPHSGFTLAAGPFRIFEDRAGEIPLYAYFYADSSALAQKYLSAAKDYLELYQKLFGPYPFPKFAVVENFFPTGYGFPSWTLLGSTVIQLPFIIETSLGHEIAHSWWGTGVRVAPWEGNWAEGLTTYVADYLYQEQRSAEDALAYRLKVLREFSTLAAAGDDFPLGNFQGRNDRMTQAVGYGKCAMLFHMLRRMIGEQAFWGTLRQVAEQRMHQEVSWSDWAAAFSQNYGQPLQAWFAAWLEQTGGPKLALEEVKLEGQGGAWLVRGTLRQQGHRVFPLQVPVRVNSPSGPVDTLVEMQSETRSFQVKLGNRPTGLQIDPDVDLFRILWPEEIPPTINHIRASTDLTVILPEGARESDPATATLLAALRQERARIIPSDDLASIRKAKGDLLFIGTGRGMAEFAEIPDSLKVNGTRVTLEGTVIDPDTESAFLVLPCRSDPRRSVALFLPGPAETGPAVARKIPHYGKYSKLVFRQGSNRVKEIWPITRSPLAIDFPEPEKETAK